MLHNPGMTLVALSASYGAGGAIVGPELADRLAVPFVDRAIPFAVSERLQVDVETAERHDQRIGRGAVIVLRDRPEVLRVRLDGPPERRAAQAARLGDIPLEEAAQSRRRLDRAHAEYARRFYGADMTDYSLYDVMLDSTAIGLEVCVELLATAARARAGA